MNKNHKLITNISIISIMSALVLVTSFFSIKYSAPVQGEIEFADVICFLLIIMYCKWPFMIVAIVPLMISDLIQLPIYAPATFVSRVVSTLIIIVMTKKLTFNNMESYFILFLSLLLASSSIIIIYYFWDLIIYGESVAIADIIGNIIQYVVVIPIVMVLSLKIKTLKEISNNYFSKN